MPFNGKSLYLCKSPQETDPHFYSTYEDLFDCKVSYSGVSVVYHEHLNQKAMRKFLLFAIVLSFVHLLSAQEYRTYDGKYNNPYHLEWGSAGVEMLRIFPHDYADGVAIPGGQNRPDARVISNALFAQDGPVWDILEQSDYCWVFGQFIDHDITLALDGEEEFLEIPIPAGDPWFDPFFTGTQVMHMPRSVPYPGTGTGPGNPREHANAITAFIDGSGVYGSDSIRAAYLRSFQGGKLRMSAGNLLPWNTLSGEIDGTVDPTAPEMANPTGQLKLFVAGDIRANENLLLLSMHTLFAREHNRLCDELAQAHPDWNDEQLYQHARKLVGGFIQHIAYNEWLPTLGVNIPPYTGYKPNVNPGIANSFSAASYRLGHSQLSNDIMVMDMNGDTMEVMPLKDAFFNPYPVYNEGIDYFLKGMAVHKQQMLDSKVVDGVRNFLFGDPGEGGLDLASLNIMRGRERGIPDLNTIRQTLGLAPYSSFDQINSDAEVWQTLQSLYGDINDIDAWVGLLSEEPMPGSVLGETLQLILELQFTALRDGDRFYFENDPALSEAEKEMIRHTRMKDIIRRNTVIPVMQDNVFLAMPQEMLCTASEPDAPIGGTTQAQSGLLVENVQVDIFLDDSITVLMTAYTGTDGAFLAQGVPTCDNYYVRPRKNDDAGNGVTTLDLVIVSQHILGLVPITSPYKLIAADANRNNDISTLDLVAIQKVILQLEDGFPNNTSWRFVPADYPMPLDPFTETFPEQIVIDNLLEATSVAFTAIKIGDLNDSATFTEEEQVAWHGESSAWHLRVADLRIEEGKVYEVPVYWDGGAVSGMQWGQELAADALSGLAIIGGQMQGIGEHNYSYGANRLLFSWVAPRGLVELSEEEPVFYLRFVAEQSGKLSTLLGEASAALRAEAYGDALDTHPLLWSFDSVEVSSSVSPSWRVSQNYPNPFSEETTIDLWLPQRSDIHIVVYDLLGRVVFEQREHAVAGSLQVQLKGEMLGGSGTYRCVISSNQGREVRTLLLQ